MGMFQDAPPGDNLKNLLADMVSEYKKTDGSTAPEQTAAEGQPAAAQAPAAKPVESSSAAQNPATPAAEQPKETDSAKTYADIMSDNSQAPADAGNHITIMSDSGNGIQMVQGDHSSNSLQAEIAAAAAQASASQTQSNSNTAKADSGTQIVISTDGSHTSVHLHPLLEKMAEEALKLKASDIFISTDFPPAFKINSSVRPVPLKPLDAEEAAKVVLSTMTPAQRNKFSVSLEMNYSLQAKNGVRFRVNAYHEQSRIGMVMRRITTEIPTIDGVHLPPILKDLSMSPRGLIILAGPTGSGKSTSQAAMIDWRNEHSAGHIVTIEDPIEYIHHPKKSIVTHREVGIDTHSWDAAMQSAMRQAPDVICVGEVRNSVSLEYAMNLAQTGHLCFFTIHANNASQAMERILNFFPEERHQQLLMDLALNVVCIIGQRLVLTKDGRERRAIVDLLINTPAMQDYIFKGQFTEMKELQSKSELDGMQTFDQDLFNLYTSGVIDYQEALRQADSVNDLRLRIRMYEEENTGQQIFDRVDNLDII